MIGEREAEPLRLSAAADAPIITVGVALMTIINTGTFSAL